MFKGVCLLACFALASVAAPAQKPSPDPYANETKAERDARMAWWREARFGMFIHWGVYAVPAGVHHGKQISGISEWIMNRAKIPCAEYQEYSKDFNPVNYDPDAWVRLAKEAGMKYIVLTSKHHEGFALYDSAVTDWDIAGATPYKKDLIAPLAEACRRHGMPLGFYYSQAQDWNHKGGAGNNWDPSQSGSMDEYIDNIAVPQVKEILTKYGEGIPAVLWWDTPRNMNPERAGKLIALLKDKPGIIHNNRLGGGFRGDTETPEQHIPATGYKDRDWETCMTINGSWGYKSFDKDWKSTETLVRNLIDIASKGGNYLLNIGPTAKGEIPEASITRLKEVGQWMKVYGDSIYGTSASPLGAVPFGRVTHKVGSQGGKLYLHVFDWPTDGKLVLNRLKNKIISARLLDSGSNIPVTAREEGEYLLTLPASAPNAIASVIEVDYAGAIEVIPLYIHPDHQGVIELSAALADIDNSNGGEAKVEGAPIRNIGFWTNPRSKVEWAIRIKEAGEYNVEVEQSCLSDHHLVMEIGSSRLSAKFTKTGSYKTYRTQPLGRVTLPAGEHRVLITPVAQEWTAVNLRNLKLVPIP